MNLSDILIIVIIGFVLYIALSLFIICAICEHMARKNAQAFNYEYLARKIADEIYKKMLLLDKKRAAENSDKTTPNPS